MRRPGLRVLAAGLLAAAAAAAAGVASADNGDVGWGGFGGTPNQNRYTPMTSLDKGNVGQLGRLWTLDLRQTDPAIVRGSQSYPIADGNRLYVTTNDDQVFAVEVPSGKILWHWKPDNTAVFQNFGIRANRGAALCDGHLFELTLDMTIVELDPNDGHLVRRVPIASGVPGASSNIGYSETSAPMCAGGKLVIGAAGSEYGVRGFVMAFRTSDLTPAWPNPVWTIPPMLTGWRQGSRMVGGGVVWTPVCIDLKTDTVFFGTGSATPLYYKDIRPGNNPRADSLIAVSLSTGKLKWWQQQMASNEWSYDSAQPPLVYDGLVGGKKLRVVSVGTMEGVWFAYNALTGQPIYQRVKVIDRTEHPPLQPGKPVAVYPSSLGGLNFSPASYSPQTNYIYNAASETASVMVKKDMTPEQVRQKLVLGDVFLGLENGNFGTLLPGWRDHGSISAIDVNTGKQIWKFNTPEPERGGVATTASGLGIAGGGDGVLRIFDAKTGDVLWKFQTGAQIASGATVFQVDGKPYVAISVGGTATSSFAPGQLPAVSQLQLFGLGGSQTQSKTPTSLPAATFSSPSTLRSASAGGSAGRTLQVHVARRAARTADAAVARIQTPPLVVIKPWDANSSNWQDETATVTVDGKPVAGAMMRIDNYYSPAPTGKDGTFSFPVDVTMAHRYHVTVADATKATVNGRPLSDAGRQALGSASGGFNVGFAASKIQTRVQKDGSILVTGHLADTAGTPPPPVSLLTYQLSGTVTDSSGNPVQGAVVITRTQDRDFWTYSSATDANGHYTSFFAASDEAGGPTVPLTVQVAYQNVFYASTPASSTVSFARLESATMNVTLPPQGKPLPLPTATSFVGAVFEGLNVGVQGPQGVIKPLAERWPTTNGDFSFVLPASAKGKTVRLWEASRQVFQRNGTRPGGLMDLSTWPTQLGRQVTQGVATIKLPG